MTTSRPTAGRRERGAALVEYALIMGLLVVVSLGAISSATTSGKSRLTTSGNRLRPTDQAYYPGAVTTTTVSGTTTTTIGSVDVHLGSSPIVTITDDGPRWQVTVTFTLLDSADNGVIGAIMNGSWTDVGQGSNPIGTCTTSTSAGLCTVQYTRIKDSANAVSFNLNSITGGGFQWVPQSLGEGTVDVICSAPVC